MLPSEAVAEVLSRLGPDAKSADAFIVLSVIRDAVTSDPEGAAEELGLALAGWVRFSQRDADSPEQVDTTGGIRLSATDNNTTPVFAFTRSHSEEGK